jgi:CheY-like chemotaxis protein
VWITNVPLSNVDELLSYTDRPKPFDLPPQRTKKPSDRTKKRKRRILSISYDEAILKTRHYLLDRAGYEVVSALRFTEALDHCDQETFDLVVLGHSLPPRDKDALIGTLKGKCRCPVLSMRRTGSEPHPDADYSLDAGEGPEALLQMIEVILSQQSPH